MDPNRQIGYRFPMRWWLYNVLFVTGFLVLLPHYLYRMWKRGGYGASFSQRFARYDRQTRDKLSEPGRIWIHAVSVGEFFVALGFMEERRRRTPDVRFLVSVTTSTAHRIARERLADGRDVLVYFPLDLAPIQRQLLRLARPSALLLVESELWPNLIRTAKSENVFIGLINGRISSASYRGYRMMGVFTRPVLQRIDTACMQTERDRDRLVDLGMDPSRVYVCGSAKYDAVRTDNRAAEDAHSLLQAAGFPSDALWVLGGSTWPGEEAVLLDIYRRLKPSFPRLALALAPRHIERMREVETEISKRGMTRVRRTALSTSNGNGAPAAERTERNRRGLPASLTTRAPAPDVFVLDTTGELSRFYAGADVVFIGKSLTAKGGQNPIEAAAWGKPVLCGPNMQNFPVVLDDFRDAEAIVQAADAHALESHIRRLLSDHGERDRLGQSAGDLVRRRMGAIGRTIERLSSAGMGP